MSIIFYGGGVINYLLNTNCLEFGRREINTKITINNIFRSIDNDRLYNKNQ
jgi:hypothetical protein